MANNNQVVQVNQKDITDRILTRVDEMRTEGLALPKNYNASNALNVAFLKLVDMKVKYQPLLEVVTKKSVQESLLNMVLQGLSPAKNQVYFIPYGDQLQMQRSYFGTQAALKRLDGVNDIWAEVIRQGEAFEFENDHGRKRLIKHEQSFETLDNDIIGAYAVIDTKDDGQLLEIMTKKQIDASWSQAKTSNVHNKFGDQMAKRTVINRAAKNYINTSDDSDLLVHAINDTTENEYDEDTRRRDVTEPATKEKTKSLMNDFKKETEKEDEKEQETTEDKEKVFTEEQVKELEKMSKKSYENDDEPFGKVEPIDAEFEEINEIENLEDLTIPEIKENLDKLGVKFDSHARKEELIGLLEMAMSGGVQDDLF